VSGRVIERRPTGAGARSGALARPVLLATLAVPFDPHATVFAVDSAVEAGQPLIVVASVRIGATPVSLLLGYDELDEHPDVLDNHRAPSELARELGVEVERIRLRSPRPVTALLELAAERRAGLLVFGPDRSCLRRRTYARAAKRIQANASCLVWLSPD